MIRLPPRGLLRGLICGIPASIALWAILILSLPPALGWIIDTIASGAIAASAAAP